MAEVKFGKEIFVSKFEGSIEEKYEVIKELHKGGYGNVYLAKNKDTGDLRAVKSFQKIILLLKI